MELFSVLSFLMDTAVMIGIYSILTLSFNLEYGFTGISNFGKAAYFLLGAYSTGLITIAGVPFLPAVLIAMGITAFIGVLSVLPAIRLRGDYLAVVLLSFGEILRLIFKHESWIAGGASGLSSIPSAISLPGASYIVDLGINLVLVFVILFIFYLIAERLVDSPYGRVLRAIREDELTTRTYGFSPFTYKIQVFAIGSAMCGMAGGLYAQYFGAISPAVFVIFTTFTIVMMTVLGGPGNNKGAILGAAVVIGLRRFTRIIKDYIYIPLNPYHLVFMIFGIAIILILMFRPSGLLKEKPIAR